MDITSKVTSLMMPLDLEWLAANIPLLKEFHDLYISELNNPAHLEPLRKSVDSPEALALVAEYDELGALEKHSEARKKELLAQLVGFAGEKNAEIQGRKLTRVIRKGNINYGKIPALQGMDLEEYRGEGSDYWRFS